MCSNEYGKGLSPWGIKSEKYKVQFLGLLYSSLICNLMMCYNSRYCFLERHVLLDLPLWLVSYLFRTGTMFNLLRFISTELGINWQDWLRHCVLPQYGRRYSYCKSDLNTSQILDQCGRALPRHYFKHSHCFKLCYRMLLTKLQDYVSYKRCASINWYCYPFKSGIQSFV